MRRLTGLGRRELRLAERSGRRREGTVLALAALDRALLVHGLALRAFVLGFGVLVVYAALAFAQGPTRSPVPALGRALEIGGAAVVLAVLLTAIPVHRRSQARKLHESLSALAQKARLPLGTILAMAEAPRYRRLASAMRRVRADAELWLSTARFLDPRTLDADEAAHESRPSRSDAPCDTRGRRARARGGAGAPRSELRAESSAAASNGSSDAVREPRDVRARVSLFLEGLTHGEGEGTLNDRFRDRPEMEPRWRALRADLLELAEAAAAVDDPSWAGRRERVLAFLRRVGAKPGNRSIHVLVGSYAGAVLWLFEETALHWTALGAVAGLVLFAHVLQPVGRRTWERLRPDLERLLLEERVSAGQLLAALNREEVKGVEHLVPFLEADVELWVRTLPLVGIDPFGPGRRCGADAPTASSAAGAAGLRAASRPR